MTSRSASATGRAYGTRCAARTLHPGREGGGAGRLLLGWERQPEPAELRVPVNAADDPRDRGPVAAEHRVGAPTRPAELLALVGVVRVELVALHLHEHHDQG